jgi:hypothetical protein
VAIPADLLELIGTASDFIESFKESTEGEITFAVAEALWEAKGHVKKYTPNPHMVQNGHAESQISGDDCPKCRTYFRKRTLKKVGGSIFSSIGSIASTSTGGVNVTGAARHARAEIKTIAHMVKLKEQAKAIRSSEFLTKLMGVLMTMKGIKAMTQGASLASNLIPIPIIDQVVGAAGTVGGKVAKKKMSKAVTWASIELHWRAFQEMKISRGQGSGPAMRMVRELFNQAFFKFPWESGAAGADQYILEPAGWMVIQDKLNLI